MNTVLIELVKKIISVFPIEQHRARLTLVVIFSTNF